eukprot:g1746.t1
MASLLPPTQGGLARRKLWDEALSGFLIGNTCARSLLSPSDAADPTVDAWELLYVGVGDLRNPLTTLAALPLSKHVTIHINDSSPLVLARCVALLLLAAQDNDGDDTNDTVGSTDAAAIAVWCDALLDVETHASLYSVLRGLLAVNKNTNKNKKNKKHERAGDSHGEVTAAADWIDISAESRPALDACWGAWSSAGVAKLAPATLGALRRTALSVPGSGGGHGRAGATRAWKAHGVASRDDIEACLP